MTTPFKWATFWRNCIRSCNAEKGVTRDSKWDRKLWKYLDFKGIPKENISDFFQLIPWDYGYTPVSVPRWHDFSTWFFQYMISVHDFFLRHCSNQIFIALICNHPKWLGNSRTVFYCRCLCWIYISIHKWVVNNRNLIIAVT